MLLQQSFGKVILKVEKKLQDTPYSFCFETPPLFQISTYSKEINVHHVASCETVRLLASALCRISNILDTVKAKTEHCGNS